MVYADYYYYEVEYKGTIPDEDSFDSLILKASREIDKNINTRLTKNKIENLSKEAQEQLKYTACALVDLINKKITSYSIDGVTKNFKVLSDEEYTKSKREILACLPDELTCFL